MNITSTNAMPKIPYILIVPLIFILQCIGNFNIIVALSQENLSIACQNGSVKIHFLKICDDVVDCQDESDEKICEDEALLLYYWTEIKVPRKTDSLIPFVCHSNNPGNYVYELQNCSDYDGYKKFMLSGVYLSNRIEFSIPLMDETTWTRAMSFVGDTSWWGIESWSNIQITSNDDQVNLIYKRHRRHGFFEIEKNPTLLKRIAKSGSIQNIELDPKFDYIRSVTVDWVTLNVYCVMDFQIKVCDKEFTICHTLSNKFIKDPILVTIAPESKLLFWIERDSPSQFSIFKYPLDRSSATKRISTLYLRSPKWLTLDSFRNQIYWMDAENGQIIIQSISYDGMNPRVISPKVPISDSTSSFVVFNDTLYWPDNEQKAIWKYFMHQAWAEPVIFKRFSTSSDLTIYQLVINHHRSRSMIEVHHPCNNSSCSHLCLLDSETTYNCYCKKYYSDAEQLPADMSSGYCEGRTLLVTYKNYLYILSDANTQISVPKIRRYALNISSIAAVLYENVNGKIILTEMGKQNIYLWTPRYSTLELIYQNGLGTINSIEFDDHANNIYWINPSTWTLKAMNLKRRMIANVLEGSSTYFPFSFTLVPAKGFMYVLFYKNHTSVRMERISMDGAERTRKVLYGEGEVYIGDFVLHYLRDYKLLCLLDRQKNVIKYFSDAENEFRELQSGVKGKIDSIVSRENYFLWVEDDLIIRQVETGSSWWRKSGEPFDVRYIQNISLGLKWIETSVLRVASISKPFHPAPSLLAWNPEYDCFKDDGGCGDRMCLMSELTVECVSSRIPKNSRMHTCVCSEIQEWIDKLSCERNGAFGVIVLEEKQIKITFFVSFFSAMVRYLI